MRHDVRVAQSDDSDAYTFLEPDASAIIGVLAVVAGEVLGGTCEPALLRRLGRHLERTGAITNPDSADQVYEAIEDLIAQVRYVADRDEDQRPPRRLGRPDTDPTAPPRGVSGWIVARDVPMGKGPAASCVLGSAVAYSTGIEVEMDLAWTDAGESAPQQPPEAMGRFAHPGLSLGPAADWRIRVDLPDGRSVVSTLAGDTEADDEPNDALRMYTQSIEQGDRFGTRSVRWISWLPLEGVDSLRISSEWQRGGIVEAFCDVDLSDA